MDRRKRTDGIHRIDLIGEGPSDPLVPVSGFFVEDVVEIGHKIAATTLIGIVYDSHVRRVWRVYGMVGES